MLPIDAMDYQPGAGIGDAEFFGEVPVIFSQLVTPENLPDLYFPEFRLSVFAPFQIDPCPLHHRIPDIFLTSPQGEVTRPDTRAVVAEVHNLQALPRSSSANGWEFLPEELKGDPMGQLRFSEGPI